MLPNALQCLMRQGDFVQERPLNHKIVPAPLGYKTLPRPENRARSDREIASGRSLPGPPSRSISRRLRLDTEIIQLLP